MLESASIIMLKRKNILFLVVLCCILVRFHNELVYFFYNSDLSTQLEATKNVLRGKGFTLQYIKIQDLGKVYVVPMTDWAIGLSIVAVPFVVLMGNFFNALLVMNLSIYVLLVVLLYRFMDLLHFTYKSKCWFFILWGIGSNFFYFLSTSDLLSLLTAVASFYWILKHHSFVEKQSFLTLFITALLVFFGAFFRYAYLPLVAIVPLFLLVYGLQIGSKIAIKQSIGVGAMALTMTVLMTLYKKTRGQNSFDAGIQSQHNWLAWLNTDYFPIKLFGWLYPLEEIWQQKTMGFDWIFLGFMYGISGVIVWLIVKRCKNLFANNKTDVAYQFLLLTIVATFVVWLSVYYASVVQPPQPGISMPRWFEPWTFVCESRYYALPTVCMQLAVFLIWQNQSFFKQFLGSMIYISVFYGLIINILFTYKHYVSGESYSFSIAQKNNLLVNQLLDQTAENTQIPVVFALPETARNAEIYRLSKATMCVDYSELMIAKSLNSSQKIILIVQIPTQRTKNQTAFLNKFKPKYLAHFGAFDLYQTVVLPQKQPFF